MILKPQLDGLSSTK